MRRISRLGSLLRMGSADKRIGKLLCGAGSAPESVYASASHRFEKQYEFPRQRRRCLSTTASSLITAEAGVVEVPLAQTGEGIADCELLRWFVQEGELVEEFQPLCEVQSDKATIEITSRYKGKVSKVNFMPGSIVKVGETLLEMMLDGAAGATGTTEAVEDQATSSSDSSEESGHSSPAKVLATPAVRGLAKQLGINLGEVHGSGKAGRIMKDDLLKLASVKEGVEEDISGLSPPLPPPPSDETIQLGTKNLESLYVCEQMKKMDEDEIVPVRGFRRAMAKAMTSAAAVPHFHFMEEVNMDALVKLKADLQSRTGLKLTYLPFLIKALSLTLEKYPLLNSNVCPEASEIRCKAWHNIGVAMATSGGLAVPNIKKVQTLSVKEISEEVLRLSKLGGDNKLTPEDVSGGTITISNFGAIGGKFGCPILNLPEAAILAVGRIQKLPRFNELGHVYPASIMSVTWGADHRVIDGATIAKFSNEWKELVEFPERWLLHLK